MSRRFLTVLCGLMLLAGCGSPADNLAFKAPAGWNSTPGIMGRAQLWMSNGQVLILVRGDKSMTIKDAERTSPGTSSLSDFSTKQIAMCGGRQQAQSFSGSGDSVVNGKHEPKTAEGIITDVGDSKYFAMYIRPKSAKPDPAAEDALHSVCAK